ncbi:MAG: 6-pyruvoyl-tetrahydropterin synthase-related protein [PVC group bacterium]
MRPLNQKTLHYLVLALILLTHLYGVVIFLPPGEQLLRGQPIYNSDYLLHFYQANSARHFLAASGRMWGYDPHLMAGYPANAIYDVGYKLSELFTSGFSFLGPARAYNLFIVITFLLPPLLIYWAAFKFGLTQPQALTATLLAVLIWHLDHNMNGISSPLQGILAWGMFTFAFACFLSVFTIGVFFRYSRDGKRRDLVLFFICGPLLLLFHLFAAVIVALPLGILFLDGIRREPRKFLIILVLWVILILICNGFWILPLLTFRHYTRQFTPGHFQWWLIRNFFVYHGGMRPLALWLFFGLLGIASWKKDRRPLQIAYLAVIVFFLFIGFRGSWIHPVIDALEPLRFIISLKCLLIIPAAVAVTGAVEIVSSRTVKIILLCAILFLMALLMPFTGRLSARLPEKADQLIDFLREKTDPSGRILVQNSDALHTGMYFGTHVLFFPLYMPIEQIGGPPGRMPLVHHFAEFQYHRLFGRHLTEFTGEAVREYLDLYNIRWIVVYSQTARAFFGDRPEITRLIGKVRYHQENKFYVFEVLREPDFFIKGSGNITATYDRIEIDNASPGEIIIKYHWLETLKTRQEVRLEPVFMLDDPVPFIKLINPGHSTIEIYN